MERYTARARKATRKRNGIGRGGTETRAYSKPVELINPAEIM